MDHNRELLLEDDPYDNVSSSPSINEEEIDFQYVYALKTFIATEQGQANAYKGDTMILLNDANSYWWLVRMVKDSSVGFLPAEHIETPSERLARLNKYRNGETTSTESHNASKAFGRIFKSSSQKKKEKEKEKAASTASNNKMVVFTNNYTYFSASEWEYSDDEIDDNIDEFDEEDEDDDDDVNNKLNTEPLANDSDSDGNMSPVFTGVRQILPKSAPNPNNSPERRVSILNSDEDVEEVADDNGHRPLLIKKTRQSPSGVDQLKLAALNVSPSIAQPMDKKKQQMHDFTTLAATGIVPAIAANTTKSAIYEPVNPIKLKSKNSSSSLNTGLNAKKTGGLFAKIIGGRNVSVAGEDLGAALIKNTHEEESATPRSKEPQTDSNSATTDKIEKQNVTTTTTVDKPVGSRSAVTNSQNPEKQSKRRSFLKAKSSIEQFGKKENRKSAGDLLESLPSNVKDRTVSVSSTSSNGSASSVGSSLSKIFKRRKHKPSSILENGELSSLGSLSSPLSSPTGLQTEQTGSLNESRDYMGSDPAITQSRSGLKATHSTDAAFPRGNMEFDGRPTLSRPSSSNMTAPLQPIKYGPNNPFSSNSANHGAEKGARTPFLQMRSRPLQFEPRPVSSPADPRELANRSNRPPTPSNWPTHVSYHEDSTLSLPDTPNLYLNESARTSIISENTVSAQSISAEMDGSEEENGNEENDDGEDTLEEEKVPIQDTSSSTSILSPGHGLNMGSMESTITKDGFGAENDYETWKNGQNSRQATENIALERELSKSSQSYRAEALRSNSSTSASTAGTSASLSSPPTLEYHREDGAERSPVSEFSEAPSSMEDCRNNVNPVIKRYWNGSSTSSIGSARCPCVEPWIITANTTNSESSVSTVTTTGSGTVLGEKIGRICINDVTGSSSVGMGALHPDILPIYKDTTRKLGEMSSRLDALLSSYSR